MSTRLGCYRILGLALGLAGLSAAAAGHASSLSTSIIGPIPLPINPRLAFSFHWTDGNLSGDDDANALAVDSRNNIVAVGYTVNRDANNVTGTDLAVVKYSASRGNRLWYRTLPRGIFAPDDRANAVAIDGADNIIVAGSVSVPFGGRSWILLKLDPNGNLLWTQRFSFRNVDDEAVSVAVDHQGFILVAGSVVNTIQDANLQPHDDRDFTVVKVDPSGTPVANWLKTIKGNRFAGSDQATAVAVDSMDNVIAAGYVRNNGAGKDIVLANWSSAGTARFGSPIVLAGNSNQDDAALAVAVDRYDNAFIGGFQSNLRAGVPDQDGWLTRWQPDGFLAWTRFLTGSATGDDTIRSVAGDGQGGVVAAGQVQNNGAGKDFAVAKWDGSGTLGWQSSVDGTAHGDDSALSVATDGRGNTVAAGFVINSTSGRDWQIAQFDSMGSMFARTYNGSANGDDTARAVIYDRTLYPAAAGASRNQTFYYDFTLGRFVTSPTGKDLTVGF